MARSSSDLPRMQNQARARVPLARAPKIVTQALENAIKPKKPTRPQMMRQYELIDDEPHHHLICTECGYMIDFDDSAVTSLRNYVIETYGFEPHLNHLAIFGRCPVCKSAGAEDAG